MKWVIERGRLMVLTALFFLVSLIAIAAPGVSAGGQLRVDGVNLVDKTGHSIVLHGMSTHGMQWFGQFANEGAFQTLKDRGANVVRIAMYTDEDGYLSNHAMKDAVYKAVDAAIAQNLYVIIDWHILHDGNPRTHEQEAVDFFRETSAHYARNPAVIYEICNEPNGNVSWSGDIKPYANTIIPAIRANSPQAVIIVGTTTWSQDVDIASQNPLSFSNVMYACHFYAGTHGQWLRDKIDTCRRNGCAVFISEWGTSAADGNGGVFLNNAAQWLDFMSARHMSWCNWSLCDKNESSATLSPGAPARGNWNENNLSESGKFVFSHF